jgi:hypothetical protein
METIENKYLEKTFKDAIKFLSPEDRETVLDMAERRYQDGLQKSKYRKEFLKNVAEATPFVFIIAVVIIALALTALISVGIKVNYDNALSMQKFNLEQDYNTKIKDLQSELLFCKKSNEQSLNSCIDRIVLCESGKLD